MKTQQISTWGPRSVSYWLTALVAFGIIFLGVRFMLAPNAGAEGFGIPLGINKAASAYGWIKGIRDIFSGIVVLIFIIQRQPRTTAFIFGAAVIIPLSDCITVLLVNGPKDIMHLMIHGTTALYMLITTTLLFRVKADQSAM